MVKKLIKLRAAKGRNQISQHGSQVEQLSFNPGVCRDVGLIPACDYF